MEVETAFDTLIMHPSNFDILNALMHGNIPFQSCRSSSRNHTPPGTKIQEQGRTAHEKLNGKAGTAIIFNTNLWHAATTDHTGLQRRTVHIYYCHPWIKPTGHTKLPSRLLESVDKPFLQEFYRTNWGAVE